MKSLWQRKREFTEGSTKMNSNKKSALTGRRVLTFML